MRPLRRKANQSYVWMTFHAPIEYERGRPRRPREFKTRDGSAFAELAPLLTPAGYDFGGQFLNVPCPVDEAQPLPRPALGDEDRAWLDRTDLLVLTIRPPISDPLVQGLGRRPIPRSHCAVENAVVAALKSRFFYSCSRDTVQLADEAQRQCPDSSLHDLRFLQNAVAGAWLKDRHTERPCHPRSTVGYVAYLPRGRAGDLPGILCVFGMGGNDTLRLCFFLRSRMPTLLGRVLASTGPRLVMFRLAPPADLDDLEVPSPGLLAPRYRDWRFDVIADIETGGSA